MAAVMKEGMDTATRNWIQPRDRLREVGTQLAAVGEVLSAV